jgi:uncharacterized membrane protein YoaK (UPF0700 family)
MSRKTEGFRQVVEPLIRVDVLVWRRHSPVMLPLLLSLCAGYLDTASFLAFHGLFAAHVTGNLVTLGASLVLGHSGALAKLTALPVFCAVVALVRMAALWLAEHEWSRMHVLLWTELLLLAAVFALAIGLGPFTDADALPAVLTGMTAVAAMAVQNAAQRLHLTGAPPSTLMTGNLTQLMIDVVDLVRSQGAVETAVRKRTMITGTVISSFAFGCGLASLLFAVAHTWCFAVPQVFALLAVLASTSSLSPAPTT